MAKRYVKSGNIFRQNGRRGAVWCRVNQVRDLMEEKEGIVGGDLDIITALEGVHDYDQAMDIIESFCDQYLQLEKD